MNVFFHILRSNATLKLKRTFCLTVLKISDIDVTSETANHYLEDFDLLKLFKRKLLKIFGKSLKHENVLDPFYKRG